MAREAAADLIVTLGAGSVTDAAKMVGLCLGNGVSAAERLDASRATIAPTGQARGPKAQDGTTRRPAVEPPAVRMIAIPTTLSAGEFSAGAGCTDTARHVKESFGHPQMMPRTVILDPAASVPTPEWLFLSHPDPARRRLVARRQRRRRFHTEGRHRRSRPCRPLICAARCRGGTRITESNPMMSIIGGTAAPSGCLGQNRRSPASSSPGGSSPPRRGSNRAPLRRSARPKTHPAPRIHQFTCRCRRDGGPIASRDNRCAHHNPIDDDRGCRRVMHRVTVAGDKPRRPSPAPKQGKPAPRRQGPRIVAVVMTRGSGRVGRLDAGISQSGAARTKKGALDRAPLPGSVERLTPAASTCMSGCCSMSRSSSSRRRRCRRRSPTA